MWICVQSTLDICAEGAIDIRASARDFYKDELKVENNRQKDFNFHLQLSIYSISPHPPSPRRRSARSSAEPPPFRHAFSVPPFPLSGKSTPQGGMSIWCVTITFNFPFSTFNLIKQELKPLLMRLRSYNDKKLRRFDADIFTALEVLYRVFR